MQQNYKKTEASAKASVLHFHHLFAKIFVQLCDKDVTVNAMYHAGFFQALSRSGRAADAEHTLLKKDGCRVDISIYNLLNGHLFIDFCHW